MTTLREAAQMALDAMLNFPDDISDDMFESIKALRAALAQPNDFSPDWDAMAVMVEEQQRMAKRIEELEAQLEQPEQEPVAWMFPDDLERFQTSETFAQAFSVECGSPTQGKTLPLYTAPPQREWVELTDEEIDEAHETTMSFYGFARAIEAKLRERNAP